MEQYEKSGPPVIDDPASDRSLRDLMERLERQVAQQDLLIEALKKDIRRLKEKMDRHAEYLNRQQRG